MKKILPITLVVLFLDITTKQLIIHNLLVNQSIPIIKNLFYITYAKNTGVAFSFLEGSIPLIIIMTIIVILFMIKYIKENKNTSKELICYGLVLGGALGNLIDRIIYNYVIDYIDIKLFNYHFPIFNIADICIVVGIFLLLILNIKENKIRK